MEGLINGNEDGESEDTQEEHKEINDDSDSNHVYPLPSDDTAPDINNLLESAVEVC